MSGRFAADHDRLDDPWLCDPGFLQVSPFGPRDYLTAAAAALEAVALQPRVVTPRALSPRSTVSLGPPHGRRRRQPRARRSYSRVPREAKKSRVINDLQQIEPNKNGRGRTGGATAHSRQVRGSLPAVAASTHPPTPPASPAVGVGQQQRTANIELLRGVPAPAGNRKAWHLAAGEITLSQMLHEWALRDLGHVRQIAELVRARKYLAGAGRLGEEYTLKP